MSRLVWAMCLLWSLHHVASLTRWTWMHAALMRRLQWGTCTGNITSTYKCQRGLIYLNHTSLMVVSTLHRWCSGGQICVKLHWNYEPHWVEMYTSSICTRKWSPRPEGLTKSSHCPLLKTAGCTRINQLICCTNLVFLLYCGNFLLHKIQ